MRLLLATLLVGLFVGAAAARSASARPTEPRAPLVVPVQDCQPERYELGAELHVIGGRAGLRRPLERLLRAHLDRVTRCFREIRLDEPFAPRDFEATITVQPGGALETSVVLRERRDAPFHDTERLERERLLDVRITACLERALAAEPLARPRVSEPSPLTVRARLVVAHTPARPCSDPAPPLPRSPRAGDQRRSR